MYNRVFDIRFTPSGTTDLAIIRITDKRSFHDIDGPDNIRFLNDDYDRIPEGNLRISVTDNDERKFTAIKGQQAQFSFFTSNIYNLNTFSGGEDDRYIVNIWLNEVDDDHLIFKGFLVLYGMSQPFLPHPTVVTLTATDNIGLLSDAPLVDFNDETPRGKYRVIEYIAMCLRKTGMDLDIWAIDNVCEESYVSESWLHHCYLDAKTFESDIGECEDCYTVLQKILKDRCFLTQFRGKWYIINIDEIQDIYYIAHLFDSEGAFLGRQPFAEHFQSIGSHGSVDPIQFINESAVVSYERPYKEVKETYRFETPIEIVDNIDFSRGDQFGIVAVEPDHVAYHVDDWTSKKGYGSFATTPESLAYILRRFEDDYEKERYLVLTTQTTSGPYDYLQSNPIPIGELDKINVSIDFRWEADMSASGTFTIDIFAVRLEADDGTYWMLGPDGVWEQSNANYSVNFAAIQHVFTASENEREDWTTLSTTKSDPCPRSGMIYIDLYPMNRLASAYDDVRIHFQNLNYDYTPLINGSYAKYSGQYNKVSQDGNYKATYEEQVYISDSPRKLFKGALFKLEGDSYVLAEGFYAGHVFPNEVPSDPSYIHPFGFLQAFSIWNQYNRLMRVFDADFIGLRTEGTNFHVPSLIHVYTVTDLTPHTRNKRFMFLHGIWDYDRNQLNSVRMVEVYDTELQKVYYDPHEFKYISSR